MKQDREENGEAPAIQTRLTRRDEKLVDQLAAGYRLVIGYTGFPCLYSETAFVRWVPWATVQRLAAAGKLDAETARMAELRLEVRAARMER